MTRKHYWAMWFNGTSKCVMCDKIIDHKPKKEDRKEDCLYKEELS